MSVYEFTICKGLRANIPVQAENFEEAEKIFNEWFTNENNEQEIEDLLESGGKRCTVFAGDRPVPEEKYAPEDILLPKEKDHPGDQIWSIQVDIESTGESWLLKNVTFDQVMKEYERIRKKYWMTQYIMKDEEFGSRFYFRARDILPKKECMDENIKRPYPCNGRGCEDKFRLSCPEYERYLEETINNTNPVVGRIFKETSKGIKDLLKSFSTFSNQFGKNWERIENTPKGEGG